ncbi:MAG: hypothetical protein ACW964_11390, partial [Candidatus Hodarchaeales archaeon]
MYPRSHNKEFRFKSQIITISEKNSSFVPEMAIEHETRWIKTIQIPIIAFEGEDIFFAKKIVNSSFSHHGFHLSLQNCINPDVSLFLEIVAKKHLYPWINFKAKIVFNKGREFVSKVPEIKLLPFPSLKGNFDNVTVIQPTRHTPITDEWKSNDMPAAYLWNPNSKAELFFFMDFSEMIWMDYKFFERFSLYECGFHSENSFGLLQRIPLEKKVQVGSGFEMLFDYYLAQGFSAKKPMKQEAVERLVLNSFKLIPSRVPFPQEKLSWNKFSKACTIDLMKEDLCYIDPEYPKYHAYVMDDAEIVRRKSISRNKIYETMTILDILPPWILHLQIRADAKQKNHLQRVYDTLKYYIDAKTNYLYNNIEILGSGKVKIIKPNRYSIGDSWYFFEPILRFGWLLQLTPLLGREQDFLRSFEIMVKNSIKFVREHKYEVAAFYDPFTLKPLLECDQQRKKLLIKSRGRVDIEWKLLAKNYACLGIHIYIMIQAYYFQDNHEFLDEAVRAANKFMEFSPDELFWEPLELAYAAAAFAELSRLKTDVKYLVFAKQIILNELRMFYWYEDNSFKWKGNRSNLGLVMACVGIRYPAMKENVESIYPWLIFLKIAIQTDNWIVVPIGIFKILNLLRINSFNYF